jgi:hypothetical protein
MLRPLSRSGRSKRTSSNDPMVSPVGAGRIVVFALDRDWADTLPGDQGKGLRHTGAALMRLDNQTRKVIYCRPQGP